MIPFPRIVDRLNALYAEMENADDSVLAVIDSALGDLSFVRGFLPAQQEEALRRMRNEYHAAWAESPVSEKRYLYGSVADMLSEYLQGT